MTERIIDEEIKLIPYYRNDEASLPWYQDLDVCKQVDNRSVSVIIFQFSIDGDCYEKRDYKEIVLRIKRRLP